METTDLPPEFTWTPAMGEISGFGGGYEAACQKMTRAGVAWLRAKPDRLDTLTRADVPEDEKDAMHGALVDACGAAEDGCSGAMSGAAARHAFRIAVDGWPPYVAKMIERTAKARAEEPAREAARVAEREQRRLQREKDDAEIDAWEARGPHTLERAATLRWRGIFFYDGRPRASLGSDVNDACADFCRLARALQQPFAFEFNGVTLGAKPKTEAEELVKAYWRGLRPQEKP
jgi:hypothetical protein